MLYNQFKGTGVAMVTPFDNQNNPDLAALERLTNHLIDGGVEFLVVMGTTGESATLNKDERKEVINKIVSVNNGRLPLVLGIGGNNTRNVIDQLGSEDLSSVDAILSVSPYYNKPTQEGIYQHYKAIANETDKPIILYNVPSRTGSNILPSTTLRLANDFKNIIAIKEASPEITQSMELILNKPNDFLVISGDDALTFPFMCCGGDGVISVVANAFPREFSNMVRLSANGKTEEGRSMHYQLLKIIDQLFAEGNPAGVKAALKLLNICDPHVRLPLVDMSTEGYNKMQLLIDAFNKKEVKI